MSNSQLKTTGNNSNSLLKILLPLLLVLVLGYAGYLLYSSPKANEQGPVSISAEMLQNTNPAAVQVLDNTIIAGHVSVVLDRLAPTIRGIKDDSGIQTASEALADATEQWDSLHAARWPDGSKEAMRPLLTGYVEQLEEALVTAYEVPGAEERIGDAATNLVRRIKSGLPTSTKDAE